MKIYMYQEVPNFGDVLNRYLWPHFFKAHLERNDDILLVGIGTLLGDNIPHSGRVIVCGTGCGYQKDIAHVHKNNWKVFFVRGPLTAKILGLKEEDAITDPAILAPAVFKKSSNTGKTIFIPHWESSFSSLWPLACQAAGITYVDPLSPVEDVIKEISGARLVITEAMHGAILADSYRVPWVPISTSDNVNLFKWTDWLRSISVEPQMYCMAPLGMSDFFRIITANDETVRLFESSIKSDGISLIKQTGYISTKNVFLYLGFLFWRLLPERFKPQMRPFLMFKLGPAIDRYIARAVGKGYFKKYVLKSSDELQSLGMQSGWLSAAAAQEELKKKMLAKIEIVNEYIRNAA